MDPRACAQGAEEGITPLRLSQLSGTGAGALDAAVFAASSSRWATPGSSVARHGLRRPHKQGRRGSSCRFLASDARSTSSPNAFVEPICQVRA